jgi:ABC-type lipoprotein export system ATPase subunit
MSMLQLRRVSKVYGQGTAGVHAPADVSMPVDEGSMVAVMEPSGPCRNRQKASSQ